MAYPLNPRFIGVDERAPTKRVMHIVGEHAAAAGDIASLCASSMLRTGGPGSTVNDRWQTWIWSILLSALRSHRFDYPKVV